MKLSWIAVGLLSLSTLAQADVTVSFEKPETFSDIKDNNGFRQPDQLKDLAAYMVAAAGQALPGKEVRLDVTDVDLAGEVEPVGRHGQWLRVMRSVTSPAITLRYEVREGGQVVRQGEARLRDMDYQNAFNHYASGDPLRYEKRMFDRWLKQEFGAGAAGIGRDR